MGFKLFSYTRKSDRKRILLARLPCIYIQGCPYHLVQRGESLSASRSLKRRLALGENGTEVTESPRSFMKTKYSDPNGTKLRAVY